MRINSIRLSWFRGAGQEVTLDLGGESAVIYGGNGSGKSCFVDAIEFLVNDQQLGHQKHEYSGKRQMNAILNTHIPQGECASITVVLDDETEHAVTIDQRGSVNTLSLDPNVIPQWDYRRTILRQSEVNDFVYQTKGDKYSTLLPLLGLEGIEASAHNIRQVSRELERNEEVINSSKQRTQAIDSLKYEMNSVAEDEIIVRVDSLEKEYGVSKDPSPSLLRSVRHVHGRIEDRLNRFTVEQKKQFELAKLAQIDFTPFINTARNATAQLAEVTEDYLIDKLEILQTSLSFVGKIEDEAQIIDCPACGRPVALSMLRAHLETEHDRYKAAIENHNKRQKALNQLSRKLQEIKDIIAKDDIETWVDHLMSDGLSTNLTILSKIRPEIDFEIYDESKVALIESKIVPIINAAREASEVASPEAKVLSQDAQLCAALIRYFESKPLAEMLQRVERERTLLQHLERKCREQIRDRSIATIREITADIQRMWEILHPDEQIEDVRLEFSDDAEKAVEIRLKFYGRIQDSPRLTLSEGYRNSLGLCVFLAMAGRAPDNCPLILDDVVISLDREHRGMIARLLEAEFAGRQVLLLTHDVVWYTELERQLDQSNWVFFRVLPFGTPREGIRLAISSTRFDEAREFLTTHPHHAGDEARRIMDTQLPVIAEKLKVRIPYRRGAENERRTSIELIDDLVSAGKKCFQHMAADSRYAVNHDALDQLRRAKSKLSSWGNTSAHSHDTVKSEAALMINECEIALRSFNCSSCGSFVWRREVTNSEDLECNCRTLRWRYGKN